MLNILFRNKVMKQAFPIKTRKKPTRTYSIKTILPYNKLQVCKEPTKTRQNAHKNSARNTYEQPSF